MTSFHYHRLPHHPSNSLTKPLLNCEDKLMEQELEIEAAQEKSAAVDRAVVDIRDSVSRLQSKVYKIESRPPFTDKHEAEIQELKIRVAKLESVAASSMKKQEKGMEVEKKRNGELEKKLVELTAAVRSRTPKIENKKEEVMKTRDEGKKERIKNCDDESGINDLVGCLMILIFLVSILIGLHV